MERDPAPLPPAPVPEPRCLDDRTRSVVADLERVFGIMLTDEEALLCTDVGAATDLLTARLVARDAGESSLRRAARATVVAAFTTPDRYALASQGPDAGLEAFLPTFLRRREWRRVRRRLGIELPTLLVPRWATFTAAACVSALAGLTSLASLWGVPPALPPVLVLILAGVIASLCAILARPQLPAGLATVDELASHVLAAGCGSPTGQEGWTIEQVREMATAVFSNHRVRRPRRRVPPAAVALAGLAAGVPLALLTWSYTDRESRDDPVRYMRGAVPELAAHWASKDPAAFDALASACREGDAATCMRACKTLLRVPGRKHDVRAAVVDALCEPRRAGSADVEAMQTILIGTLVRLPPPRAAEMSRIEAALQDGALELGAQIALLDQFEKAGWLTQEMPESVLRSGGLLAQFAAVRAMIRRGWYDLALDLLTSTETFYRTGHIAAVLYAQGLEQVPEDLAERLGERSTEYVNAKLRDPEFGEMIDR